MSGLFSDPKPPAPADVVGAAKATSAGNQNAAILNQYGNMVNQVGPEQSTYTKDASGNYTYTPSGTSTGVTYTPYTQDIDPKSATYGQMIEAKRNDRGDLPFNMAGLTDQQKADYYAGKGLPKNFNMAYDPLSWSQSQKLGVNDQQLFNESQAAQLQLSGLGLTGLDAVRNAVDPKAGYTDANGKFISTYNGNITPTIAIQGGPTDTANRMTTSVGGGTFSGGAIDTGGVQYGITDAGKITSDIATPGAIQKKIADAGSITKEITTPGAIQEKIASSGSIANDLGVIGGNVSSTGATGVAQTALDNNGNLIRLDSGANQQARGLAYNQQNAGKIQTSLGIDPQLLNQQTQDALYKANTQYLDPQFAQSQSKMESQLANQGITRGSEAYNNAMLNFNNQKQQAYESARNQAIAGSTAAAQGMFGMGLQGAQFGNQALGQQFGQYTTAQQLANSAAGQNNANAQTNQQLYNAALGQQFGQGLQSAQFANQAIAQNNANAVTNANFANAAQQQATDQMFARAGIANSAQAQLYGQNANDMAAANAAQQQKADQTLAIAGFKNAAQAQQFGQNANDMAAANAAQQQGVNVNLALANFKNTAQEQQFGQNLANLQANNAGTAQQYGMIANNQQLRNAAQQQTFDAGLANANLNNQQLSQLYNQNLQSAQLSNQASNQQLAQNQAIQQNPLNILQALRTGAQLNTANLPAVGVSQPGQLANWQGADFLGAAQAQNQFNQGQYNAQMAANSQLRGAVIGAGGAIGGGALASDRKLKKNIKRVGTHILGIGLYTWDYLWGQPFSGVMADEVEQVMPEAIVMHPSGFKMVNYSMLGLM